VGKLCEKEFPAPVTDAASKIFARAFGVDLSEADPDQGPYSSFDAFFTRKLRTGARIVDDTPVVSPADGRLVAAGPVTRSSSIVVKGREYDVAELCGSAAGASRYEGGEYAVVYLHPRDYHRVHSPVDGKIVEVRSMPGDLFPVNAIGERHVPRLFVRNQRVSILIESEQLGTVDVIMVGATIVGRITTAALGGESTPPGEYPVNPALTVRRGDELGTFHLGSTVVLLLPGSGHLSQATGPVLYGQSLGRANG
jgi:phosphatidylserine decarboxylase